MGSNTRRKSFRWLVEGNSVLAHAIILKGGVLSGRTICGLESRGFRQSTSMLDECASCRHSIDHNVLVQWSKP